MLGFASVTPSSTYQDLQVGDTLYRMPQPDTDAGAGISLLSLPTSSAGIMDTLRRNQTAVFIVAGGLLLLALMKRR